MSARARVAASPTLRGAATGLLRSSQRLRRGGSATKPVLVNSIPKAGTHLAAAVIETAGIAQYSGCTLNGAADTESAEAVLSGLAPVRPGFYVPAHIPFASDIAAAAASSGIGSLFVVREPRAVAASHASFVMQRKKHRLHRLYADMASPRQRLRTSILGVSHDGFRLPPLAERLQAFEGWLDDPHTLVVRFEDLVGSAGGGSDDTQMTLVRSISTHCGVPEGSVTTDDLTSAFGRRSTTFAQGTADGWRAAFDDDLLALTDEVVGEMSRRFGYA